MAKLRVVTVPGPWQNQPQDQFYRYSTRFPYVEWGIQYRGGWSNTQEKFPPREWVQELCQNAHPDVRFSLHLHREYAEQFLMGEMPSIEELGPAWRKIRRVHICLTDLLTGDEETPIDIPSMMDLISSEQFQNHPQGFRCVTVQIGNEEAHQIAWEMCEYIDDIYPLFDMTADSKIDIPKIIFPQTSDGMARAHGYAANFTPENVNAALRSIEESIGDGPFWLQLGKNITDMDQIYFGPIADIIEPMSPLYQTGCCKEVGAPIRASYINVRDLEREWVH